MDKVVEGLGLEKAVESVVTVAVKVMLLVLRSIKTNICPIKR